jgi:hypothetical protein
MVLQSELSWTSVDPNSTDFYVVPTIGSGDIDVGCLRKVLEPPVKHGGGRFDFEVY